jgi:hypothetical protein
MDSDYSFGIFMDSDYPFGTSMDSDYPFGILDLWIPITSLVS